MFQYNITYRKKDNGWQYIISYKDKLGKWKQKSKQGFENSREGKQTCKEAAEDMVKELKDKLDTITYGNHDEGITFEEFAEKFVEHEKLYKEHNTINTYFQAFTAFSDLNQLPLQKINSINIQSCVDTLVKKSKKASTISLYLSKLNILFKYAITMHVIAYNPNKSIQLPKDKNSAEKTALSKAELEALLKKIKYRKYYIASLLASKCGLRAGEILGLTWEDIDEGNCEITVVRQWKNLKNGKYGAGTVKTKNSTRVIPVPPIVLSELSKYKKEYPISIDKRVLPYPRTSDFCHSINEHFKRLGFNISIHELRHTYATTLISAGLDFKTVAKLMGHDVKETIKTYSHVNDDMMNRAKSLINKVL